MGLQKGMTNNIGGRPKGSTNKITTELRERINDFLSENWEQIEKDFLVLEPDKRVLLFEKLLSYTLPKMQSVQMRAEFTDSEKIDLSTMSTEELIERARATQKIERNIIKGN